MNPDFSLTDAELNSVFMDEDYGSEMYEALTHFYKSLIEDAVLDATIDVEGYNTEWKIERASEATHELVNRLAEQLADEALANYED